MSTQDTGWNWDKTGQALGVIAPLFGAKQTGPNFSQAINLFNTLSLQQQQMLNKAVAFNQLGINKLSGAFDRARTGVKQSAGVSKQGVREQSTQALAGAQNSAVSRGLYNTSTFDAASRGIGSDLAKHLAWIDSQESNALGQLDTAQAGAEAAGYGHLGSLFSQFGANQAALAGPLFQGMVGAGAKGGSKGGGLGDVLGAVGGIASIFSDPRLKKNAVVVGTLSRGIPIYQYEYTDPSLPGLYEGVMAPDVEHLGVVSVSPAGYKMVDYEKLRRLTGFEFKKISDQAPKKRSKRGSTASV